VITILNALKIDVGAAVAQEITLWLVCYGSAPDGIEQRKWHLFVEGLADYCAAVGWLLACGDDSYEDKSLAVFAEC